jgi:hypothetical protein
MSARSLALCLLACSSIPACTTELGARAPFALGDEGLVSGAYTYDRPEVGSISGCTATLVGPRLVLTAAHCLDYGSRTSPGRWGTFEIRRAAGDAQRFTIERYVSFGRTVGADDVALIRLASEVPASVAIPAGIARTEPSSGTPVTIFGYGCQVRGSSGRWAKQRLDTTWGRRTTNLCPGDSGGPTITPSGEVVRINSGYWLDAVGADIFGSVPVVHARLLAQAAAWGDSFGAGAPSPGADAGSFTPDAGSPPRDAGSFTPDAGAPPPPPPGDGPCAQPTCGEATALPGCGWCDATGRGIRVGAYGEALEPCASGYRLNPEDCGAAPRSTCGPWSGITTFTCRRGATQFVRCVEGGTPEFLTCPSGYTCAPGSTERMCYR